MSRLSFLSLTRTDYTRRERLVSLAISVVVGILAAFLFNVDKTNRELSLTPDYNKVSLASVDDRIKFDLFRKAIEMDIWQRLDKVRSQLVVVAIDDYSLLDMDWTWPINRSHYADLVKNLADQGAETIGLDILFETRSDFPEADASLKKTLARPEIVLPYRVDLANGGEIVLPHPTLVSVDSEKFVEDNGFTMEWSDYDGVMRKAILTMVIKGKTYYSWDVKIASRILKIPPAEVVARLSNVEHTKLKIRTSKEGMDEYFDVQATFALVRFANPSKVNTNIDSVDAEEGQQLTDGKGEILPGVYKYSDVSYEESRTTLDQCLTYINASQLWRSVDDGGIVGMAGGLVGPEVDAQGNPVIDPATGQPKPRKCAVIVGVSATAGSDIKVTPVGRMSGLDMHAYTVASILQDAFFRAIPPNLLLAYFVFWSLLAGVLLSFLSFRSASIFLLLAFGSSVVVCREAYLHMYNVPLVAPILCMGTSFLMTNVAHVISRNIRIAQRDERIRQVQNIIRELTPVDVEELLANNGLALGGKATELTVLFSDLRGYTSMAEKLQSVEVIDRLNDYFALLGPILERFGGAVFDYQGDALMAVFGLKPASQPNHAAAGCKAAAGIIYALEIQRKEWLKQGKPMPETGIGLCTGLVAFGGLGTAQHKQYVAIGDPTNTASRMQGKSKELDSPVLITESTYQMALQDESVVMRYLEEIELKGKREPLKVYEVSVDETAAKLDMVGKIAPGPGPLHKEEPIL